MDKTTAAKSAIGFLGWIERGPQKVQRRCLVDSPAEPNACSGLRVIFRCRSEETKFDRGTGIGKRISRGMVRLNRANRVEPEGHNGIAYVRYLKDFSAFEYTNVWTDIGGIQSRSDPKIYVVQSATALIQRCLLMCTDPGDLMLDPTCGSGTTATVAEQWGRRWITIDTSRVALALARARIMGARYPFYLLSDSRQGQLKEAEVTRIAPSSKPVHGNIRHGFVYERVPHITLKSIANNAEIDVIWEQWQARLDPLREKLNAALKKQWQEWEIPRDADKSWPEPARKLHADWWQARIGRQKEIDASIAAKAEFEYLYDKPYDDKRTVRVAGPSHIWFGLSSARHLLTQNVFQCRLEAVFTTCTFGRLSRYRRNRCRAPWLSVVLRPVERKDRSVLGRQRLGHKYIEVAGDIVGIALPFERGNRQQ
jgi:hypothetical protein